MLSLPLHFHYQVHSLLLKELKRKKLLPKDKLSTLVPLSTTDTKISSALNANLKTTLRITTSQAHIMIYNKRIWKHTAHNNQRLKTHRILHPLCLEQGDAAYTGRTDTAGYGDQRTSRPTLGSRQEDNYSREDVEAFQRNQITMNKSD